MTDLSDWRQRAADLDAAAPLRVMRERFVIDDDLVAYFDGNSLGRLPRSTERVLAEFVREQWGGRLIRGWSDGWVDLPVQVGDELGALIGAAPGQTVVTDSTSVCLAKALHAAAALRPERSEMVMLGTDFPTDRYLAARVADDRGLTLTALNPDTDGSMSPVSLAAALSASTAVVLLTHVDYRTGALLDLPALTAEVHAAGGVVVWDLCHSIGVVPTELDAAGVDFAVGCTYKYLNAGPGAPAFLYAAARHLPVVDQPLPGWWSADDLFAMAETHVPASDARRLLTGTPGVAGLLAVREGVRLAGEGGVEAARAKSIRLTELAIEVLDALGGDVGLAVVTPRDPARRGSHVTVRHPRARCLAQALTARGVVPDFREPDLVRLGLAPLTTSFAELIDGLEIVIQQAAH